MSHTKEMREALKLSAANAGIKQEAGTKHDSGKPELSLIPTSALIEEAKALSLGKAKYGLHNYKGGFEYTRLLDAALRHIHAFKDGENLDQESLASHLGHARACLAFLIDMEEHKYGIDNRYRKP